MTHGKFFVNKNFTDLVFASKCTLQKKLQRSLGISMVLQRHFTACSHSERLTLNVKGPFIVIGLHHKNYFSAVGYALFVLLANEVTISYT